MFEQSYYLIFLCFIYALFRQYIIDLNICYAYMYFRNSFFICLDYNVVIRRTTRHDYRIRLVFWRMEMNAQSQSLLIILGWHLKCIVFTYVHSVSYVRIQIEYDNRIV